MKTTQNTPAPAEVYTNLTMLGTPATVAALRAALDSRGVKARVRLMPNGCVRVVLANLTDRPTACDALAAVNACTVGGGVFTTPANDATKYAWTLTEVFVRFCA